MRISRSKWVLTVSALALPGIAYAQYIPPIIVALALSPLLVMLFAVVLGVAFTLYLFRQLIKSRVAY